MLKKINFFKFLIKPPNDIEQTKQKYLLAYKEAEAQLKLVEEQLTTVKLQQKKIVEQYPKKIYKTSEYERAANIFSNINKAEKDLLNTKCDNHFGYDRDDPASSLKKINALKQSINQNKINLINVNIELKAKSKKESSNRKKNRKMKNEVESYESKVTKARRHYGRKKTMLMKWMSTHCPEEAHNLDLSNQATLQNKY